MDQTFQQQHLLQLAPLILPLQKMLTEIALFKLLPANAPNQHLAKATAKALSPTGPNMLLLPRMLHRQRLCGCLTFP
ncbi:hypothetical protein [Pseudocnuella soli]|uniref:hypothetical protein n=1 Tax=Pseudocnuella soli TaxID=2502779 RepID=UPI0010481A44|nr:hypothetical protein [Pseudocnuella soli]